MQSRAISFALLSDVIEKILPALSEVGQNVRTFFDEKKYVHTHKADGSPVGFVDMYVHNYLVNLLTSLSLDWPIISEEGDQGLTSNDHTYWLIDPLDGTRQFIKSKPFFTINVALIHHNKPILGLIAAPMYQSVFYGYHHENDLGKIDSACFSINNFRGDKENIIMRVPPSIPRVYMGNMKEYPFFLEQSCSHIFSHTAEFIPSALKFCLLAQGCADLYYRFRPTYEWDTAAGHAIILGAGGVVETLDGKALQYGKENWANPHFRVRPKDFFNDL